MYLDKTAEIIRKFIPQGNMPEGDSKSLLRLYAVLLRVKGERVTSSDVHDAWSVWMMGSDSKHKSIQPYGSLDRNTQKEDKVFVAAIQNAAKHMKKTHANCDHFAEVLFPKGPPGNAEANQQILDLYKIMVASSESLVNRRQAVNTFFLTINGALITAYGFVVQFSGDYRLSGLALVLLAIAGVVLGFAWRSLIKSFGQLNRGKFRVINAIEQYLGAAIYAAEWEALGRGENPKIYRSFTSREIWAPNAFIILHLSAVLIAISVAAGCINLAANSPATEPPPLEQFVHSDV